VAAALAVGAVGLSPGAGATTSTSWLSAVAQPATAKLQQDQQALTAVKSAHARWAATLGACRQLVRDSQSAKKLTAAPTQALRSAWKAMVVSDLQYAQACVLWARSKGTKNGGSVTVLDQQLRSDQKAWSAAASAAVAQATTTPEPPSTTTTTAAPQTPAQFEASCTFEMPFSQLVTESGTSDSSCVTEQGSVYQYDNNTGSNDMLVAIGGNASDLVDVQLSDASMADGIATNDTIQFWGPISGSNTFSDPSGNNVTIPVVAAMYITLVSSAGG